MCTVSWGHLCTTVVTVLHQSPRGSTLKHIPLCPRILVFPASPPLHVWLSPSGSGLAGHLAGTSKSLLDPHLLSQRSWDSPGDVRVSQSRRKAAIPWLVMGKPSPLGEQRDTEPQGRVRAQTSHTAGPRMGAGARGWSQAGCWLRTGNLRLCPAQCGRWAVSLVHSGQWGWLGMLGSGCSVWGHGGQCTCRRQHCDSQGHLPGLRGRGCCWGVMHSPHPAHAVGSCG